MSILFSEMLHFVKRLSDFINSVAALPPNSKEKHPFLKLFFQDEEIIILVNTLKEIVPITRKNIEYRSKSFQKIRLAELVARMEKLRLQLSSDTRFSTLLSSKELEAIEIWSFKCEKNNESYLEPLTYGYIDLIFDELSRVNLIPKVQLQSFNLSADSKKVYINLEWHGPFESIEYLSIPGIAKQLWQVTCDAQKLPLSFSMMRYLLCLQVVIAWGENELIPIEVLQDGTLIASLQFLQAISPEPNSEQLLSEIAWQNASDYLVQQSYPSYLEVSQKLELKLNDELERRIKYAEQGLLESKDVNQIREWVGNLADFRQAYLEEISGAK